MSGKKTSELLKEARLTGDERERCRLLLKEAVIEATRAYEFHPSTYTYHTVLRVREAYTEINATTPPALDQKEKA